jgi:hypothetical protein
MPPLQMMLELCPRGNNKDVIIIILIMIMFIFYTRIVLSGNINTCVVYEKHHVPSTYLRTSSLINDS